MHPNRTEFRIAYFLDRLQSPINIGQCLRSAEIYGLNVFINDAHGITRDSHKRQMISDFSCGAAERRGLNVVRSQADFLCGHQGRVVATCLSPDAVRLPAFDFEPDDLVVFGNEYDGLDAELIESADAKLYVPMPAIFLPKLRSHRPIDPSRVNDVNQNGMPNLNVAVTAGIIAYAYTSWAEQQVRRLSSSVERTTS